jgi:hypothetical protein
LQKRRFNRNQEGLPSKPDKALTDDITLPFLRRDAGGAGMLAS